VHGKPWLTIRLYKAPWHLVQTLSIESTPKHTLWRSVALAEKALKHGRR